MAQSYKQFVDQALDFWLARGAVLVIVILQIAIVNDLMVGPRWLAPAIEREDNELVIIDEIHTPDSSRFWQLASYDERLNKGEEPEYFDKEFLRMWFKAHCDPYQDEKLPDAPTALVEELSRRYIRMYEQITGEKFVRGEIPIEQRIERNVRAYGI